jgi:hypothetical protein
LNIGFGRGREGDEDADVDALGLGLLLAIRAAVRLGDDGDGVEGSGVEIEDTGRGRLGNLMRSFRDSVVSLRARIGCALVVSTLTNSGVFSSPSLSSSITSVSGSDSEGTRCGRSTVGLVVRAGPGAGEGERRTVVVGIWLSVWPCGEVGIGVVCEGAAAAAGGGGVGVCVDRSGAREGAVSSKVR